MGTATFPAAGAQAAAGVPVPFRYPRPQGKYLESKKIFQFKNSKTRILFFSATNPESIESATALGAVLDEAGQNQFKRGTYEAVLRRLSLSQGRVLFGTTLYNLGWFKTEVYDRWKAGDKDYDVIEFPSIMNPAFPREEFERARQTMPAWKFDMFYRGATANRPALFTTAFDTDACVKRFPIPPHWPVYVGHDFGQANPAAMFYAHDPVSGEIYPFHEYLPGPGRSTYEHVQEFKKITQGLNVVSDGRRQRHHRGRNTPGLRRPRLADNATQDIRRAGANRPGVCHAQAAQDPPLRRPLQLPGREDHLQLPAGRELQAAG